MFRVTSFCGRDSGPPAAPPRALRSRGALPGTDRRPAARSPRPSPCAVATHERHLLFFNPTFTPPSLPPFALPSDRRKLHGNAAHWKLPPPLGPPKKTPPLPPPLLPPLPPPVPPVIPPATPHASRSIARAPATAAPAAPSPAASPPPTTSLPESSARAPGGGGGHPPDLPVDSGWSDEVSEDDVGWGGPAPSQGTRDGPSAPTISSEAR